MESWLNEEVSSCAFKDKRISQRFKKIILNLSQGNGKTIPEMCGKWAIKKATYRFLSNERIDESEILSGHFEQTSSRIAACGGRY
jgi:hypothetical protein